MILLAILTASAIGSEYGMGTLRPILIRGTGRWTFLASKFLVLILVAAVALLVVGAVSVVSSVVATGLANLPPGGVIAGSTWTDAAAALGKGWGSLIPYVVFTALLTIVTRSSAAGMAIGLGYAFAEPIMVALLKLLFSGFGTVAEYLLAQNISAFTSGKLAFNQGTTAGPGQVHAALVLAAYTIVFGIVAVWLFQRRDIAGANAG
jgi:ABC-type transport system involved in multi-copper enzyme maturation permease subunit